MRLAVLVVPQPPVRSARVSLEDAPSLAASADVRRHEDDIAWLRETVTRLGFHATVVEGGSGAEARAIAALAETGPGDVVLLHVHAPLAPPASVRVSTAEGLGPVEEVSLGALADAALARGLTDLLFVAEVTFERAGEDAFLAAEHVAGLRDALDPRSRGFAALLAARPRDAIAEPLAFTRVLFQVAEATHATYGRALLSDVADRLRTVPESHAAAQSYVFVRGFAEFDLAALPDAPGAFDLAALSEPPSMLPPADDEEAPSFDLLLALADGARDRGELELALAGYRAALIAAAYGAPRRALVLRRIGTLERARGRRVNAQRAFEKALASLPADLGTLDSLRTLATESGAWGRVVELSRRRLALLTEGPAQVDEHFYIARLLVEKQDDVLGAVDELVQARAIAPERQDVLEALRRAYRVRAQWDDALEVTGALAALSEPGPARAERLFEQARLSVQRLQDEVRGLDFLEATLAEDPAHAKALEAFVAFATARKEEPRLEARLTAVASALEASGDRKRALGLRRRFGLTAEEREARGTAVGAAQETPLPAFDTTEPPVFTREDEAPPAVRFESAAPEPAEANGVAPHATSGAAPGSTPESPPESQVGAVAPIDEALALADALLSRGAEDAALAELEEAATLSPRDTRTYARLFAIHTRAERPDPAYLAALALEELGVAGEHERAVLTRCRPDGLRVRAPLGAASWGLLRAPGADDVVEALLASVARVAPLARVDELRARRAPPSFPTLDPSRKQAETSTASAVRTFRWAARALGVPSPALYVLDRVDGGIAAVPVAEPTTALGPTVMSGLSTKELAFLAGRHITYYRPEYRALVHFPTSADLTALVLAAVHLVIPSVPIPSAAEPRVAALSVRLAHHLKDGEQRALHAAVHRLEARSGKIQLPAWVTGVERTAARAGLLLCGDLHAALPPLRREGRSDFEHRKDDLLAFCASRAFAELRTQMAMAVTSYPPPAASGIMSLASHAPARQGAPGSNPASARS